MNESKEHHHEGANLDQSCRSTKIMCYLKEDQSEFLEERRQKDLVNEFASLTTSESTSEACGNSRVRRPITHGCCLLNHGCEPPSELLLGKSTHIENS